MAKVGQRPDILNDCEESIKGNKERDVMRTDEKSESRGSLIGGTKSADGPSGAGWIPLSESIYMCNLQPLRKNANVFKGKQKFDGGWRDIAVKLLPHSASDIKEINLYWKLENHPNIIQIYDAGESRGIIPHIYIAMELCSQTLKDFIDEHEQFPFDLRQHFVYAKQIVSGVASIHKHNILHRDIKLENILLSSTKENIRVADFGLSTQLKDGHSDITASARGLGSDGYRAPELLYEKPTTSFRSDSFSIGIVLAMLFSKGHHPFGPDPARWRTNISDNKGRDLSHIVTFKEPYTHKREQLVDLIEICLQRKASRRPTPQEMLEHEFFTDDAVMKQEVEDESEPFDAFPDSSHSEYNNEPTPKAQAKTDATSESPELKADKSSTAEESPLSPEFNKVETSNLLVQVGESVETQEESRSFEGTASTEATSLTEPEKSDVVELQRAAEPAVKDEVAASSTEVKKRKDTEERQSSLEPVKTVSASPSTGVKRSDDTIQPHSTMGSSRSEVPGPSSEPKSDEAEEGPLEQFLKAKKENIKRLESELARSLREGGFEKYSQILKDLTTLQGSDDLDVAVQLAEYELMSKRNDSSIMKLRDLLSSSRSRSALDVRKMGKCLKDQGNTVQAFILYKVAYEMQKGESNYSPDSQLAWINDCVISISSTVDPMIASGAWCSHIAKTYGIKYSDEMLADLRAVRGTSPGVRPLREISCLVSITSIALECRDHERCIVYGEEGITMMKQELGEGAMFYKDYGGVLNNLGNAYDRAGNYLKAVQCYNEAIKAKSAAQDYDNEGKRQKDVAISVNNLGNTNGKILADPK